MCTVTYVPLKDGFLLCSNRDERMSRSRTLPPAVYQHHEKLFYYPRDEESSGTWIAVSDEKATLCLLNGAFEKHIPHPPYRKSRGLVLLDILAAEQPDKFIRKENFSGIEPFTLVMVLENQGFRQLWELRWDGLNSHILNPDGNTSHIWSSSTLYPPEVRKQRELWFEEWLRKNPLPSQEALLAFHRFGGEGNRENDLVMSRSDDRQTISITSVYSGEEGMNMLYRDLIKNTGHHLEIQ